MSRGINKVILVGHLGGDPEVRYLPNGKAVANINVATTSGWRDKKTNEMKEQTEWHRVVLFDRLGEVAEKYLKKGSQVYIEGSMRTRKWQDNNQQDRYTTEIVAREMQMLGGRGEASQDSRQTSNYGEQKAAVPSQPATSVEMTDKEQANFDDDDIPF